MNLKALSITDLLNLMQDVSSEIFEQSQNDFRKRLVKNRIGKVDVQEVAVAKDIQLAVDGLNNKIDIARELFKETGKVN